MLSASRPAPGRPACQRPARRPPAAPRTAGLATPPPRRVLLLHKPYGVLCQFTDDAGRPTLADFVAEPGVYAAGRLDRDSEGLVVLTNDGNLIARLTQPRHHRGKTYWVQVEGTPSAEALQRLRDGVVLNDGPTRPADVREIPEPPGLWPRTPPVRFRARIPTTWLEITLREGRNRQVRRMTACVGLPTLRLIRYAVDQWTLDGLEPGQWRSWSADAERRGGGP